MPPMSLHGESLPKMAGRHPFERVHQLRKLDRRRVLHQEVDVIVLPIKLCELATEVGTDGEQYGPHGFEHGPSEDPASVLGNEDQVDVKLKDATSTVADGVDFGHRPSVVNLLPMAGRFRLYPDDTSAGAMMRHCADARYVWNLALEQANTYRAERGPTPNSAVRMRQLADARSETWLGEGSSVVQQQALRDFDQALQNWWGGTHHRPTWRKAGQSEGFRVRDLSVAKLNRKWGTVYIAKVGPVRFRLTRPWGDVASAKSARVTLDRAGRWHVSFTGGQPPFERTGTGTGSAVGLDMGIAATLTTSAGEQLHMPALLTAGEAQRKHRLQRRMSRQCKGSRRRARTKALVARLAAREADRRKDWIEKTTTQLVRDHDVIAVEDLKVSNMVRSAQGTVKAPGKNVAQKRGLNRSIQSQAWALLRQRLEDKALAAIPPVVVVAVNPANTSRRCSGCGHTAQDNRKSQAVFSCQSCGYTGNADVNAALNILTAGLAVSGRGADCKPTGPSGPVADGVEASTPRTVAA